MFFFLCGEEVVPRAFSFLVFFTYSSWSWALLHQGDSLLSGHCVYVHCVVILLLFSIFPGLEVIWVVCLLHFLESSSSVVWFLAHSPKMSIVIRYWLSTVIAFWTHPSIVVGGLLRSMTFLTGWGQIRVFWSNGGGRRWWLPNIWRGKRGVRTPWWFLQQFCCLASAALVGAQHPGVCLLVESNSTIPW